MPIYELIQGGDHQKLQELRTIAQSTGNFYFISRKPKHACDPAPGEGVILVMYNPQFREPLKTLLKEIYELYGCEEYGMDPETTLTEFYEIKLGSCVCGYTDMDY